MCSRFPQTLSFPHLPISLIMVFGHYDLVNGAAECFRGRSTKGDAPSVILAKDAQMVYFLWFLAVLLVLSGIAGMILPALPGSPLLFAGLLCAAWAEDFAYAGWRTLTLLGCLAVLAWLADFIAGAFGAKRFGASNRAMAGELTARADLQAASRAGIGAFLGLVLGTAAKMALAFAMIGIFLMVRLF
jgi:uncharacterized protein YqgC (DUF456 family)